MHTDIISPSWYLLLLFYFTASIISGGSDNALAADNASSKKITALEEQTKLDKAETAALIAKKERETAENDLLKAQLGTITNSGIAGEATTGDKAGKAEAMLLGAVALNEIANQFASQIKQDLPDGKTLLLLPSDESFQFNELRVFNTSYALLERQDRRTETQDKSLGIHRAGPAADMVKNLLSLFKTDYKFSGVDIDSADDMLLNALANALKTEYSEAVSIELPRFYNRGIYDIPGDLMDKISDLNTWAKEKAAENKPTQRAEEAKTLLTNLSAVDNDKKSTMFSKVVLQSVLQKKIQQSNTYLVLVQPTKLSGSMYTKKNLWSSLGSNPFHVMGGAVASYTVIEGSSGKVMSSRMLPVHGGYHSVSSIQKIVNGGKK